MCVCVNECIAKESIIGCPKIYESLSIKFASVHANISRILIKRHLSKQGHPSESELFFSRQPLYIPTVNTSY